MVEKPSVSAFQNFLWIENWLNIKIVMGRNVWMCFVLTASTYIALNALEIVMPYVHSVDIYSIWGHCIQSRVEFSHLIVLCMRCCVRATNTSVLTVSTNIAFNALHALIFVLTVSTNIPFNALHALIFVSTVSTNIPYTKALLWSFVSTVSTFPLMYTQQIRWQWVASSLSNSK